MEGTIGWKFNYPANWSIMTEAEIEELEGKARGTVEEVVGGKLEELHENVLYLRKNPFNRFTSTIQGYDSATHGPYAELQSELFEVYLETYRTAGISLEHETGTATVDGLEFQTMSVTIHKPGTKEVLMHQLMFDRLFGGKTSLLMSLNWNNEKNRAAMQGILDSSSFSIRD